MYRDKTISVIIPCLNEEHGLVATMDRIPDCVDEVVVVDNGSTDRTAEVAKSLGAVVVSEPKRGYSGAHLTGYRNATKEIIITADGDGTYPLTAIPHIVDRLIETGAGFLCTVRYPLYDRNAMHHKNFIGNQITSLWMSLLFKTKFSDGLSGMWAFRRELLDYFKFDFKHESWDISPDIKLEAYLRKEIGYAECHIHYAERTGEVKNTPWRTGLGHVWFIFMKRLKHKLPN